MRIIDAHEGGDPCPQHGTSHRKTYTYGRYGEAEVHTFKGCACAICVHEESLRCGVPLGGEFTIHPTYSEADGRAHLIVAGERVRNAPFE